MRIDVVTLFPEMFEPVLGASITGRARERGLLELGTVNPRDFAADRHRTVDDRPYGGGAGMVLMAEPLYRAIKSVRRPGSRVVGLTPRGARFDAAAARRLARAEHLVLVCGHYEGFDERVLRLCDEEVSIGDFVLTGGELPAMMVADAVARLLPGVLKKADAAACESFEGGLLEAPHYTRPRVWRGRKVPEALLSGDHERIADWRRSAARRVTRSRRPDLLKTRT
ncbi:MAG: tRNA (guanosine(37)-N1)-methyltransferase TrmD [Elusimicrobia bacterium RIFOXYA2_FULL_69_6]|nr:MAG: tRNA (guanosine(37)-N1)-methyltransferase TrmD [Elusimicrobia bacterium RIFOXYA2_FULL_69_6]